MIPVFVLKQPTLERRHQLSESRGANVTLAKAHPAPRFIGGLEIRIPLERVTNSVSQGVQTSHWRRPTRRLGSEFTSLHEKKWTYRSDYENFVCCPVTALIGYCLSPVAQTTMVGYKITNKDAANQLQQRRKMD